MIPMARIDPTFAKQQLELFLREWYLSPNGQIPAYEFNFSDVNPPVHAAGVMAVYKFSGEKGNRDNSFLAKCFQKLIMNFTWYDINSVEINFVLCVLFEKYCCHGCSKMSKVIEIDFFLFAQNYLTIILFAFDPNL